MTAHRMGLMGLLVLALFVFFKIIYNFYFTKVDLKLNNNIQVDQVDNGMKRKLDELTKICEGSNIKENIDYRVE